MSIKINKREGISTFQRIKGEIKYISDFFQWNLIPYKKEREINEHEEIALKSLKSNSFYLYKNFLSSNQISELKKKINNNINEASTDLRKEHLYRQRSVFSPDNSMFKDLLEKGFIMNFSKRFYNVNNVNFMKLTYELKKGLGEFNKEKVRDENQEYHYHCDRSFGWLKFCLFLDDVGEDNGPFCIIPKSHNWPKNIIDFKHRTKNFFTNDTESPPLPTFDKEKLKDYFNVDNEASLTGKKGDLMIVNTAAYHKGANVKKGFKREVLWFYTIFPSSFENLTRKVASIIKKK